MRWNGWLSRLLGTAPRRSASVAKQRLQLVISQQPGGGGGRPPRAPDYLPALQRELQLVVAKHARIEPRDVSIRFGHTRQANDALEVRIELPRTAAA